MLMRNLSHGLSDANEKPYAINKYDNETNNMKLADKYQKYIVALVAFNYQYHWTPPERHSLYLGYEMPRCGNICVLACLCMCDCTCINICTFVQWLYM